MPDFLQALAQSEYKIILDCLTLLAALGAIVISLYTLNVTRATEHETATQTLIHAQYQLCRDLDVLRVDNPDLSHMLPLPSETGGATWKIYDDLKRRVRTLIEAQEGPITEAVRNRLYLREHATALNVCNIYEQTLLQLDLAEKAHDKKRMKVLKDLVEYYEKKMLRSPRMRFHWDHGASDMLDQPTRDQYDKEVRHKYDSAGDWTDEKSPVED